jgi:hypothetical protein
MIPLAFVGNKKTNEISNYVDNLLVSTGQIGRLNPF